MQTDHEYYGILQQSYTCGDHVLMEDNNDGIATHVCVTEESHMSNISCKVKQLPILTLCKISLK